MFFFLTFTFPITYIILLSENAFLSQSKNIGHLFNNNHCSIYAHHPATFSGWSHFCDSSLKTSPTEHPCSLGVIPFRHT